MNKIALLIPYFGKWPEWMDLYLYSVNKNKMLDVFFFTDCPIPEKYREIPNIFWKRISYHGYCDFVSCKLNINFKPKNPYKLCDLKPFMGYLHEDCLKGYDFWGFGDIDLVYGDLTEILTPDNLKSFDVISTNSDRLSGPFCLIRNADYYKKVCFKIKNWEQKLEREQNLALDERDFSNVICPFRKIACVLYSVLRRLIGVSDKDKIGFRLVRFIHSFWQPLYKSRKISLVEYFATQTAVPAKLLNDFFTSNEWMYKDGKLWGMGATENMEFPYLHFLFLKKTKYLKTNVFWKDNFYHIPVLESLPYLEEHTILINHDGIYLKKD